MKRPRTGFLVLLAAALAVAGAGFAYRDEIRQRADLLILPVQMILLYNKAPDAALLMPVDGIEVSEVADTWGAARPGDREHQGQDIFARRGTPVRSATAGFVVRKGVGELGGNYVFVIGAGGRRYYYAHLDSFGDVETGDEVTTETVLGFVGDTGNAKGLPPHLHFGMYDRGAQDPLPLLIGRGE